MTVTITVTVSTNTTSKIKDGSRRREEGRRERGREGRHNISQREFP
jgi:hypothetical protein